MTVMRRILVVLLLASCLVGVGVLVMPRNQSVQVPAAVAAHVPTATPTPSPTASPTPAPQLLVAWHGPVDHLFFHPLVIDPRLAFRGDGLGRGFRDYFVTAREFR